MQLILPSLNDHCVQSLRTNCRWHAYRDYAPQGAQPYLSLNASVAGTGHGLAKLPYLRDTRRSAAGIGGFRIFEAQLAGFEPNGAPAPNGRGYRYNDTIAIGDYFYADIHSIRNMSCDYPEYLPLAFAARTKPYYIPFRALTVRDSPNLLVAGKTMAQSFWANGATRLHPEEWASGTAAGVAAALMARGGLTSQQMYDSHLPAMIATLHAMGAPTEWHGKMDETV